MFGKSLLSMASVIAVSAIVNVGPASAFTFNFDGTTYDFGFVEGSLASNQDILDDQFWWGDLSTAYTLAEALAQADWSTVDGTNIGSSNREWLPWLAYNETEAVWATVSSWTNAVGTWSPDGETYDGIPHKFLVVEADDSETVPEPGSVLGLLTLGAVVAGCITKKLQAE